MNEIEERRQEARAFRVDVEEEIAGLRGVLPAAVAARDKEAAVEAAVRLRALADFVLPAAQKAEGDAAVFNPMFLRTGGRR